MDTPELIRQVRGHVAQADTRAALGLLLRTLEHMPNQQGAYQEALSISAKYEKTKRDEEDGVVSYENAQLTYNLVNRRLLSLLTDLEAGRPVADAKAKAMRPRWLWPALGVGLLVAIGGLVWGLGGQGQTDPQDCPRFSPKSAFNMLVLPYLSLTPDRANIHLVVRDRLNDFSGRQGLGAEAEVYRLRTESDEDYPSRLDTLEAIGRNCGARLVIWGSYERKPGGTNEILTRYRFLDMGEFFSFRQLYLDQDSQIDTVTSLSNIATQGVLTTGIEQIISRLLLGLVAHQMGQDAAAIHLLEDTNVQDDSLALLRQMALADCYVGAQDYDKARHAYDEALVLHPNYGFALKNRAAIAFAAGDLVTAEQDLTTHLDEKPEDAAALNMRTQVFIESGQVMRAKTDLETLSRTGQDPRTMKMLWQRRDAKAQILQRQRAEAEQQVRNRPNDTAALQTVAKTSLALGDYAKAATSAEALTKQMPNNPEAYGLLMEAAQALNRPALRSHALKQAQQKGVTEEAILQQRPALKYQLRQ